MQVAVVETVLVPVLGDLPDRDRPAAGLVAQHVEDLVAHHGVDDADVAAALPHLAQALRESDAALVGHRGVRLSGGQVQRLALARALATDAELLLADDVSSALDAATEIELWAALRERRRTVIGATAKRMQEYLGLSGPAAGFMMASGLLVSGATVKYADFVRPGVECELAVRLGRDLPPGPCTQEQAAAAVDQLVAGIEIVENRYDDIAVLGTPTLIADQVYHAAAVVGAQGGIDWHSLDFTTLAGHISINGQSHGEGRARDLLGHPLNSLAWLAASPVAAAFGGLKAGQVVMLGSVTPPIWAIF